MTFKPTSVYRRVLHGDDRVVEPHRHQRHQPCAVNDTHLLCGHERPYEGVIGDRRTDEPEPGRLGLLGGSFRTDQMGARRSRAWVRLS